jgi:hypothetical protein
MRKTFAVMIVHRGTAYETEGAIVRIGHLFGRTRSYGLADIGLNQPDSGESVYRIGFRSR